MKSSTAMYLMHIFTCICFTIAVFIFTKGFLLKRVEIHDISSCRSTSFKPDDDSLPTCWPRRYSRAILLIVDALRYDFVSMHEQSPNLYYHNKLVAVNDILINKPAQSALYRFVADPPTTTMQRLKGLTGGSLPTFVDASSNFAKSEILEDNFIKQLVNRGERISFMGDDTWLNLYPNHFNKSLAFPSLNVKDLDTVDDGIIKHLVPEIRAGSFDLLIAHFLGVDHCGHTFGPDHPRMTEKLTQMDTTIRSVVDWMDDDTVLFVLGDHGMTRTGDHGGDSYDELNAALFVYSNSKLRSPVSVQVSQDNTVRQIDLVPTISLLLGLPIPFSNLGMVIPELISQSDNSEEQIRETTGALALNSRQVRAYLNKYTHLSGEFSKEKLADLEAKFLLAEGLESSGRKGVRDTVSSLRKARENYRAYLHGVRSMCEQLWAKFDLSAMFVGCVLVGFTFVTCICSVYICYCSYDQSISLYPIAVNCVMITIALTLVGFQASLMSSVLLLTPAIGVAFLYIYRVIVKSKQSGKSFIKHKIRNLPVFTCACFGFYLIGNFSNSFVVFEDKVTAYLLQTIVIVNCLIINTRLRNKSDLKLHLKPSGISRVVQQKSHSATRDVGRILTSPRMLSLLITLAFCLLIKLTVYLRACREEQWTCQPPGLLKPISAITDDQRVYKSLRYFFSVVSAALVPYGLKYLLQRWGNLNGLSPVGVFVRYGLPVCCACLALYWATQVTPKVPSWAVVLPPRIVYIAVLLLVVLLFWRPLAIHVIKRSSKQPVVADITSQSGIPEMYAHLKRNWRHHLGANKSQNSVDIEPESGTPMVYGLATVYSATVIGLLGGIGVVCALLLGDGISISVPIYLLAMLCFLELHACVVNLNLDQIERRHVVPWSSVIGWCFLVSHFFFATGHQTTVPSIRFEAAFIGFVGDHLTYVIPAVLIVLNTFASHVMGVLALPLLLFWPLSRGVPIMAFEKGAESNDKGEFVLQEKPGVLTGAMFQLCTGYLALAAAKVLSCMLAAVVLRRHLMVWKIFAPHLVYEAAAFFIVCFMLLFVMLLVRRIDSTLNQFIKSL